MTKKANDVLVRALKTFWQAALASLAVSMPSVVNLLPNGWEAVEPLLTSAIIGALAAGFSALYNGVLKPMLAAPEKDPEEKEE